MGKTAVVTGAASGMGLAFAEAFLAEGMKVVMADIEAGPLQVESERLGQAGEVLAVRTDVADSASVDELATTAIDHFGDVHVLCNNAGVGGGGPTAEIPLSTWEWVLGVDLWGVIHGTRAFLPHMLERGDGHIVNTASVAGQVCFADMAPYNVAKFGVVALSESVAEETKDTDVNVSCLCPGFVATRLSDSERNRPEHLRSGLSDRGEEDEKFRDVVREVFGHQKPPAEVAELVVAAIRDEQFWIFTDDHFQPRMADRADAIQVGTDRPMIGRMADAFFE